MFFTDNFVNGADKYLSASTMLGGTTVYCFKYATMFSRSDGPNKFPSSELPSPEMKDRPEKKRICLRRL